MIGKGLEEEDSKDLSLVLAWKLDFGKFDMLAWKLAKIFETFERTFGLFGDGEVLQALMWSSFRSVKAGFRFSMRFFKDLIDGESKLITADILGIESLEGDLNFELWSGCLDPKRTDF